MKIGLIFAGITFGHKSERDFSHCFPNINRNLIEPLKSTHEVNTYVYTYDNDRMEEVNNFLNPTRVVSIPFDQGRQNTTRAASVGLTDGEDIDFYIMSRFDVHYNKSLEDFNIDWDKFNFTSREGNGYWERERFVGDTFYAWPRRLHEEVKMGFMELSRFDPNHMHNFYSILSSIMKPEDIHFMSEEPQLSGHLLTSICTRDYASRLRNVIPVNEEILERFK
jgi:hypothetical protein